MDYQGNASKPTEPEKPVDKQIEKVVTGEVIRKPKSIGQKFKGIFFGGDFKMAAKYVAADVILPSLRNLFVDVVSRGAERVAYGESYSRRRPTEMRSTIQYNRYSNSGPLPQAPYLRDPRDPRRVNYPDQPPRMIRTQRRDFADVVVSTREEATLVVERLMDIIEKYELVSLADLYELLGLPSTHTDNKWGWSYLGKIEIRQIREGYLIELPQPEEIMS